MTVLLLDENRYRIQFRHQSKLTKRPSLFRAPMNVLTTCVIVVEEGKEIRGVAIGHAMCMPGDNFRKCFARDTSFARAVSDCALLTDVKGELLAAYEAIKPISRAPAKKKFSARDRSTIAAFLEQFVEDSLPDLDNDGAEKILRAAQAIWDIGSRVGLPEAEREARIAAGASVKARRGTPEGRSDVNREKRERRIAIIASPQAAG